MKAFVCVDCKKEIVPAGNTPGYGRRNSANEYGPAGDLCFDCCAIEDKAYMIETGAITLYLTRLDATSGKVSNWPGTMSYPCRIKIGKHNIARVRYDVWFRGPDGKTWHGVTLGNNTRICHCKRTKEK